MLTVKHTKTHFFFKPYPHNAPSRAPTQDLVLLLGGRVQRDPKRDAKKNAAQLEHRDDIFSQLPLILRSNW